MLREWPPPPDKMLPSTAPTGRAPVKYRQPSSPLLGWQRLKVASAGTHITLSGFISTRAFADPSSTSTTLLPTQHPCLHPSPIPAPQVSHSPVAPAWGSLQTPTHSSHRHPMFTSAPRHNGTDPLPAWYPRPKAPLLSGWSSLKFVGEHTDAPHAHPFRGRYRHLPPAAGTRHSGCDPHPSSRHWRRAPHSPPSALWRTGCGDHVRGSARQTHWPELLYIWLAPFIPFLAYSPLCSSLHTFSVSPRGLYSSAHSCTPPGPGVPWLTVPAVAKSRLTFLEDVPVVSWKWWQ